MIEQYKLVKTQRIESLANVLCKALEELATRDLKNTSTKDLLTIILSLEKRLKDDLKDVQYHTGILESSLEFDAEMLKEKTSPLLF